MKVIAYVCKHTRVFQGFWETFGKRNKKREICYKFALWKVETLVDVKHSTFEGLIQENCGYCDKK